MEKMLNYYGFESLEDVKKEYGFYNDVDATRYLIEIYEEDTAPMFS